MNLFKIFTRQQIPEPAPVKTERELWLDNLPLFDEPTAELWETVCENTAMGELIEVGSHRIVYVVTDGGNVASENWWVIDGDGLPVAYFRDYESISEYTEA